MNSMRIEAGPHTARTSQGEVLQVERPLSVQQADVLMRVLKESNLSPDDVFALELHECGVFAELVDREDLGNVVRLALLPSRTGQR